MTHYYNIGDQYQDYIITWIYLYIIAYERERNHRELYIHIVLFCIDEDYYSARQDGVRLGEA